MSTPAPKVFKYKAVYVQRVSHTVPGDSIAEAAAYAKLYAANNGLMLVCVHQADLPSPLAPM